MIKNKEQENQQKQEQASKPRLLKGVAVGNAKDKTVKVLVNRYKFHPKYRKRYKVTKKYLAHDEENKSQKGEKLIIKEVRPISKYKKWAIVDEKNKK